MAHRQQRPSHHGERTRGRQPATPVVSFTALGIVLFGFSIGVHAAGVAPAWHRGVGLLAATLLLVTGLANGALAGGSPIVYVGLMGFALWLVWLITTGVRVLR